VFIRVPSKGALPPGPIERERERVRFQSPFACLSKLQVKELLQVLPKGSLWRQMTVVRTSFNVYFRDSSKEALLPGSPGRAPIGKGASFPGSPCGVSYGERCLFPEPSFIYLCTHRKKNIILGPYIPTSVPTSVLEPSVNQINPWTSMGAFGPRIHSSLDKIKCHIKGSKLYLHFIDSVSILKTD